MNICTHIYMYIYICPHTYVQWLLPLPSLHLLTPWLGELYVYMYMYTCICIGCISERRMSTHTYSGCRPWSRTTWLGELCIHEWAMCTCTSYVYMNELRIHVWAMCTLMYVYELCVHVWAMCACMCEHVFFCVCMQLPMSMYTCVYYSMSIYTCVY